MSFAKDWKEISNELIDYNNFAEEVAIISEVVSGNYSLYTIENKNVVFRNVIGASGISDKGILGFLGGDRGRPALISVGGPATTTTSTTVDYSTDNPNVPTVSVVGYSWDIRLVSGDACGDSDEEIKRGLVNVL